MKEIEAAIKRMMPQDKCLHVIAGVVIFAIAHFVSWRVGMAAVLVVGVAKESLDHFTGSDASIWDVIATVAGGLLGLVCVIK